MDTWEVKGRLWMLIVRDECLACKRMGAMRGGCEGHSKYADIAEAVEADNEVDAIERSYAAVVASICGTVEDMYWVGSEPTAINVSALARDRAALAAWNMALPIPGGPPIEWGKD